MYIKHTLLLAFLISIFGCAKDKSTIITASPKIIWVTDSFEDFKSEKDLRDSAIKYFVPNIDLNRRVAIVPQVYIQNDKNEVHPFITLSPSELNKKSSSQLNAVKKILGKSASFDKKKEVFVDYVNTMEVSDIIKNMIGKKRPLFSGFKDDVSLVVVMSKDKALSQMPPNSANIEGVPQVFVSGKDQCDDAIFNYLSKIIEEKRKSKEKFDLTGMTILFIDFQSERLLPESIISTKLEAASVSSASQILVTPSSTKAASSVKAVPDLKSAPIVKSASNVKSSIKTSANSGANMTSKGYDFEKNPCRDTDARYGQCEEPNMDTMNPNKIQKIQPK